MRLCCEQQLFVTVVLQFIILRRDKVRCDDITRYIINSIFFFSRIIYRNIKVWNIKVSEYKVSEYF